MEFVKNIRARLEAEGVRVTYLRPDRQGFIEARVLEEALTPDTVLVSVQAANSEVGSIQPIAELAALAHRTGALFHTDAVQALGKMPLNMETLGVDAASFSAHKIGGPKGVGALYLKARTPFAPFLLGGGQEGGQRLEVLFRQHLGGGHQGPLTAAPGAQPAGVGRHHRLARAHVPLDQPVHGPARGHVLRHLVHHPALSPGGGEGEQGEKFLLGPRGDGQPPAPLVPAVLKEAEAYRQIEQLLKGQPPPGQLQRLFVLGKVDVSQGEFRRRQPVVLPDVLGQGLSRPFGAGEGP